MQRLLRGDPENVIVGLDPTICTSLCCTDPRVKPGDDKVVKPGDDMVGPGMTRWLSPGMTGRLKNEYKENSWDFLIIPLYYVFR